MNARTARPAPQAITSLQNERIKGIRALDMRKTRRETGLFVAEGTAILVSARERGRMPQTLVAGPGALTQPIARDLMSATLDAGGDVLDVSAAVLEKLSAKDNPQSLLGVYAQAWSTAPDLSRLRQTDTWLLLEAIRDPGNLGTIIRTAHAAGAAGIILAGACCDPYQRECVRATMGSIFAVPLVRLDASALPGYVRDWPGDTIATHLDGSEDFRDQPYRGPALLVMGSEGPGLSDEVADACARRVKIPMSDGIDSLNLAIATALMLYQIQGPRLAL